MHIKYLGTGAAEGIPCLFCECDTCKTARERKGRHIRTRSQLLIDGTILLDFPSDTFSHAVYGGLDLTSVRHCFITHSHSDHIYPEEIFNLNPWFAHVKPDTQPFTLYGNSEVGKILLPLIGKSNGMAVYKEIKPFEPTSVDSYHITALKAVHGTVNPYFYLIEKDGKSFLYAHDTDVFPDETWNYLEKSKKKFNLVSFDCTEGAKSDLSYHGHMCLGRDITCRDRMLESGMIDSDTRIMLNHFSHNGLSVSYDEFQKIASDNGFEISYDGMEIEF